MARLKFFRDNPMILNRLGPLAIFILVSLSGPGAAAPEYQWPGAMTGHTGSLQDRIPAPSGFERIPVRAGSFAEWLRNLPVKAPGTPIHLYDGRIRVTRNHDAAVINIDTGDRDLQQCADAIMRLRAEYLLSTGRAAQIAFDNTSGQRIRYRGAEGNREAFSRYMTRVFAYSGTYSLERELTKVKLAGIQIGDIFIEGGFPGHAVLVADIARNPKTGEKRFLLIQSFMPAQDMHVLNQPGFWRVTPWFDVPGENEALYTPDWTFKPGSLRRFSG